MSNSDLEIEWPNGKCTQTKSGSDWIRIAHKAGIDIPTGCLEGRCGACEIEVNGEVMRACINNVPFTKSNKLKVNFTSDPSWGER